MASDMTVLPTTPTDDRLLVPLTFSDVILSLPQLPPLLAPLLLSSTLRRLLEVSLLFCRCTSSLSIKFRIISKVIFAPPAELLTAVTVLDQLSGKDDSSSNAWTSSSKQIPTDVNLDKIELNSF